MSFNMKSLLQCFTEQITGEWGVECTQRSQGTKILRTTNFTNDGILNYNNVVVRFIEEKRVEKKKLRYGDIIIEKSGGSDTQPVGRVVYFDNKDGIYLCNNFTQILRTDKNLANSRFVFYFMFLQHKIGATERFQNKTTGIRNLKTKDYLETKIFLPSLTEQNKVVDVLDIITDLISKRKEQIALLDKLEKNVFVDMFGDPVNNPMGWDIHSIEDLAKKRKNALKAGPFGSSLKKEFYVESGYKIYGQEQVISGDASYGDYYISESKYKKLISCAVQENDVLISLVGTYGKMLIVPYGFEPGIINPRLAKISFDLEKINPVYFKYYFSADSVCNQLDGYAHGGTMGILNLGIIKKMLVPTPPIEIQSAFASKIMKINTQKSHLQNSLAELETTYKSTLQKAFNGELFS